MHILDYDLKKIRERNDLNAVLLCNKIHIFNNWHLYNVLRLYNRPIYIIIFTHMYALFWAQLILIIIAESH